MFRNGGNTSYLEINKDALKNNFDFIYNNLNNGEEFYSVIKGNAYGHGIEVMAPIMHDLGQNKFAVFSTHEAYVLSRSINDPLEIMIMGWMEDQEIEWAIENNVSFYVFDIDRLEAAVSAAQKLGKPALIHIELETGMHRTGFEEEEFNRLIAYINRHKECLHISGLCTHYAGAESIANHLRVQEQIEYFNKYVQRFKENGIEPDKLHTACSAAMLNYPKTKMDMVRVGILQYGFWPSRETLVRNVDLTVGEQDPLRRIISWKTYVMSLKYLRTGEFAGYGNSFMAEGPTKLAVIPVGYAHGYARSLSNTGRVIIGGQRMSVVGTVNMNMMLVDVTNVPNVEKGDEVVIIGEQGNVKISISSFGNLSNLLNYELLTRLPQDIPRYIVEDK